MDVRKKNTYEVLDMIEKNLISESDIIYYIENDYLDNQLLEDVMDTMFSESSIKELKDKIPDLENDIKSHHEILKSLPYADKASYMKHNFIPVLKEKNKLHAELEAKEEEIRSAEKNLEAAKNDYTMGNGSAADVEEAQKRLDFIKSLHNSPSKVENPKHDTSKITEPKTETKAVAPKQTETKVETNNNGHTETPKTGNDEHAEGIWEKFKSGYHSIKQSAGEHLAHAKQYAMEHPGIAGAAAAGAALAGLAAYAGYKHLKNKKALTSAHEGAHKAAMDSISKTHGHLAGAAAAHIHNDIRNVINSNREMFKKDPRKSREQLVNHFGSDEYKKHLISKISK